MKMNYTFYSECVAMTKNTFSFNVIASLNSVDIALLNVLIDRRYPNGDSFDIIMHQQMEKNEIKDLAQDAVNHCKNRLKKMYG